MKLDLRSLIAGEMRSLSIEFRLTPEFDTRDPRSNLYGVRFTDDVAVSGVITNDAGYMFLSLDVSFNYVAPCARCLCDTPMSFSYRFEKPVALASVITTLDEDKRDEYVIIEDGFLDIDSELLEICELEFPSKILCRDDCKGLCPKCGKNLNLGDCSCPKHEVDPRLAKLQALFDEMNKE